jgi:hypothetical protein
MGCLVFWVVGGGMSFPPNVIGPRPWPRTLPYFILTPSGMLLKNRKVLDIYPMHFCAAYAVAGEISCLYLRKAIFAHILLE